MAGAPSLMRSEDLIRKEPLDYGAFGDVYLCLHKTLGQVVQKTVYTGPPRQGRQKQSLLEEGSLMSRLNHPRVVKLLGFILEDNDYSLVMELVPKGNLLNMLEKVFVPFSLRGRIVLEILEGMTYLTENRVVHKDLKPENILVDMNIHIKIADLGLATSEMWRKLTREESQRKSRGMRSGGPGAGTLCFMAPEHLENINSRATEKSDVYSFAIVVWVVLTCRQPFEEAMCEDQISLCVRQGQRPDESRVPADSPPKMVALMKSCWHREPQQRPTFKESYENFLPFYQQELEERVKDEEENLMMSYEGPEELVTKLRSFTNMTYFLGKSPTAPEVSRRGSRDSPAPLLSCDGGPVEASVEDLSRRMSGRFVLESDATPDLDFKLEQEYNYHVHGSRIDRSDQHEPQASSVKSWSRPSVEEVQRPELASHLSLSEKTTPRPAYSRYRSFPDGGRSLVPEPGLFVNPSSDSLPPVYISNASRIQIGNNNTMNFASSDRSPASSASAGRGLYRKLLQQYAEHPVSDAHLDLVRHNVRSTWKQVARKLGLSNVAVETIEHDYERDGLAEKVHQMLEAWKMREGLQGVTVGKLCQALDSCVQPDVLQQLLHISQTTPT